MRKYKAAVIQLDSQHVKKDNLQIALDLIDKAASDGVRLAALPEDFNYIGPKEGNPGEPIPGSSTLTLMKKAKEHGIYIIAGSVAEENPNGGLPLNTCAVIDPRGEIVVKYSKIHMFDISVNGTQFWESRERTPGDKIVTVDTVLGRLGLSICYDLRFPELYRIMALKGAQLMFVPANFLMNTGKDHWLPLLKARAIENGCYVLAPCQCGKKYNGFSLGKSVIIDPWGNVIANSIEEPCVVTAEIDLDYLESIRNQIPSMKNRMENVYEIKESQ